MEEQSKLTNLLEKILGAFESTSSRVSDSSDESDDEKTPKKLDELMEIVKTLRKEIAELKIDQKSIEVTSTEKKKLQFNFENLFFRQLATILSSTQRLLSGIVPLKPTKLP